MTEHTVVMHRTPRPRIETSLKPRPVEPEAVDIDCIAKFTEQERIWGLIRQSAEGVNQVGSTEQ